jgi:sortase A
LDVLVRYLRTHRWARRALSGLTAGLVVAAVGMLGYPFYTNLYQSRKQSQLSRQFASPKLKQAYRNGTLEVGDALTRIKIPKLDVDVLVVEGTTASALRAGAGHYVHTRLPCETGTVAIAGHRTTYGKPFANLDRLDPGDAIILETPIGRCTYEVSRAPFLTTPKDTTVVANDDSKSTLTLTSCHPKGSALQRIIIKATLSKGVEEAA